MPIIDTADLVAHRYNTSRERQANIYEHLPCITRFTRTPPIKELKIQATLWTPMIDTGDLVAHRYGISYERQANIYKQLPCIALFTRTLPIKRAEEPPGALNVDDRYWRARGPSLRHLPRASGKYI